MVRHLPSVMTGGPPGENRDVRLRGMDKEFSQILVDGHPFPDGGQKREIKLDRFPMDLVERIDLIRNPSAEFGGHGIAGTVNIILRRPPEGPEFRARTLYGPDSQRNLFFSAGTSWGPWGLLTSFSQLLEQPQKDKRENQRVYLANDSVKESRGIVEREQSRSASNTGTAAIDYWIDAETRLHGRVVALAYDESKDKDRTDRRYNASGVLTQTDVTREREIKNEDATDWLLGVERRTGEADRLAFSLGYAEGEESKDKGTELVRNGVFNNRTREFERKPEYLFNAQFDWAAEHDGGLDGVFKTGLLFDVRDRSQRRRTFSTNAAGLETNTTKSVNQYDLRERIHAWYLLDEWEAIPDTLFLSPGVRVEWTDLRSFSGSGGSDRNRFEDTMPSAHLLWHSTAQLDVEASCRRSLQRPQFDHVVPSREETATEIKEGNPALSPALSENYEVGFTHRLAGFRWGANTFYRDIDDLIAERDVGNDPTTGKRVLRRENVGPAQVRGIELEARAGPEAWGLTANWSRLDSETEDDLSDQTGSLKEMPSWTGNLILDLRAQDRWWFQATAHMIGPQGGTEFTRTQTTRKTRESYEQIDMAFRGHLPKGWAVLVRANDVFGASRREEIEFKRNLANLERTDTDRVEEGRDPGVWVGVEWKY
ncbi:MAG: TonB-dependent receptor [Planctomycetes bacterium]|nr:TonB-dependent receptor [Planctomycetota bacterium]